MATSLQRQIGFRHELEQRGGGQAARCFQCATCSSVCELAQQDLPFPRRQMLWAQWGMIDQLAADPCLWLCHQCNDCTARCPRDARPGDVMGVLRSVVIEHLSIPRALGRFIGKADIYWPILMAVPIIFWVLLLLVTGQLSIPALRDVGHGGPELVYGDFVPHWLIYVVFFPTVGFVSVVSAMAGWRFWNGINKNQPRPWTVREFVSALYHVLVGIASHDKFETCKESKPRRWGHFALMWGFVGAAVTSGFLIVEMYIFHSELPLPMSHEWKLLGNFSAILLVFGGTTVLYNRLSNNLGAGPSSSFDSFFLAVVLLVIASGVLTEAGRFILSPTLACSIYIVHLGMVLCLFLTFPYSKFSHILFRTLALVQERLRLGSK